MELFIFLVAIVGILGAFYAGIILGIYECKRSYGIAKGVTPEQFNDWCDTLAEMAYDPYKEVDADGCI